MQWLLIILVCALGTSCADSNPLPVGAVPSDMNRCMSGCVREQDCSWGLFCRHGCCVRLEVPPDDLSSRCPAGTECNGQCVHLRTDSNNCGFCGNDCTKLGGGSLCCTDHCVNPATDIVNCGGCGNLCQQPPNGLPACVNGHCVLGGCNPGFDSCDQDPDNGCETVVSADPNNCGACGNVCPVGVTCVMGKCAGCPAGLTNCLGACFDLIVDARNCGACGNLCLAGPHGLPSCNAGRCSLACRPGFGDCDGQAQNGCEVDIAADNTNCGACGNVCAPNRNCVAGKCTCLPPTTECRNLCVNLQFSNGDCGACGNVCIPPRVCANGQCM